MYEVSEIAAFANSIGFDYHQTIELMENDRFVPFYETKVKEIYIGYGKDYGLGKELTTIIDQFVVAHGECEILQ